MDIIKIGVVLMFFIGVASANCETGYDFIMDKTYTIDTESFYELDLSNLYCGYAAAFSGPNVQSCKSDKICATIANRDYDPLGVNPECYVPAQGGAYDTGDRLDRLLFNISFTCPYSSTICDSSVVEPEDFVGYALSTDQKKIIFRAQEHYDQAQIRIWLNGTNQNYTYELKDGYEQMCENPCPPGSEICLPTYYQCNPKISVTDADFSKYYRRNFTFRDESSGNLFSFLDTHTILTVACDNNAPFTKNLTQLGNGSITIQTKERPRISVVVEHNNITYDRRLREDSENFLLDNFYLTKSSTNAQVIPFRLLDYTGGQFFLSTVKFQKPIGDNPPQNIEVHQFGVNNLVWPLLLNETNYKIVLTNENTVRDLGNVYIRDNTQKDIIVTTPDFKDMQNHWDDLNLSLVYDYNLGQISCAYQKEAPITLANLTIYNVTTAGKIRTYSTTSTALTGSLSYTATNLSSKYIAYCSVQDPTRTRYIESSIQFQNTTTIYGGFDMGLPERVFGIPKEVLYLGMALIPSLIIAGVFGMLYAGIGAIVFVISILWFTWIGWLTIPWWFNIIMLFLAIMYQLSSQRPAVVS